MKQKNETCSHSGGHIFALIYWCSYTFPRTVCVLFSILSPSYWEDGDGLEGRRAAARLRPPLSRPCIFIPRFLFVVCPNWAAVHRASLFLVPPACAGTTPPRSTWLILSKLCVLVFNTWSVVDSYFWFEVSVHLDVSVSNMIKNCVHWSQRIDFVFVNVAKLLPFYGLYVQCCIMPKPWSSFKKIP